jgi:hypothetical protein
VGEAGIQEEEGAESLSLAGSLMGEERYFTQRSGNKDRIK